MKIEKYIYSTFLISIVIGVFTGFIGASVFFAILLFLKSTQYKLELIFFSFLLTFILANNFSGPLSYNESLRFSILGITLIYLYRYKIKHINLGLYTIPFVSISLIVTLLFSFLGAVALLKCLAYFLIAFAVFKITPIIYLRNTKFPIILFNFFFVFILVHGILIFIPSFYLVGRFKGLLGNPNGLAMLLVFIYGITDLLKTRKELPYLEKKIKLLNIAIWFMIVLTGSRTALIAIICYVVLKSFSNKVKLRIPMLLLVTLALVVFFNLDLNDLIRSVGLENYIRLNSLESASGRKEVWIVAWEEIKNNFWFGQGFTYDNFFIKDYADRYIPGVAARQWNGVWSSYLSLLLNVGIIGLLCYILMVVNFYKKAQIKPIGLIFMVMVFLVGFTESWMAASMNPFTPLFFLYWAIQNQPLRKTT
ncbi:O-antigen ligase family protein [Pseudotamlana agarivorans]|uniref:O-antigen ligase family protein n=1 Tax=Pseudotamlana agarivorans TaxID=481183 RepID=UPI0012FBC9A2|nr:O-antigen ligase family protein [Tamlana agarivorans]